MEIREPRKSSNPALDWSTSSYSVAAKSLQSLAEDITNISAANFERNAKLIDDLRGARTVEDLVSIQTKFMAGMFEAFNDHVRLMGSRMAELRTGLMDGSPVAPFVPNGTAAPDAGLNQVLEATNVAMLGNLKATQDITRSAFEAAEKAADTIRDATRTAFSPEVGRPPVSRGSGG
jgi:hypothetical protein